jgi:hypothetical protein
VSGGRLGTLRAAVVEGLAAHGIASGPRDTPAALRERLNDAYLEDVRRLRERQRSGDIPLAEYASHVEALKRRYPLLGLPLSRWTE